MLPLLSTAWAQGPAATESPYDGFCASEGMLAWQGDPYLRGAVRLLRISQFAAGKTEHGELVKRNGGQAAYCVEFTIGRAGELLQDVRMHTGRPEEMQVTKYQGNSVSLFDARNPEVSFHYVQEFDSGGRIVAEHLHRGEERIRTESRYTYDEADRLKTSLNSLNQLITYSYDEQGRLVREDWAAADAPEKPFASRCTTYDSQGRVIAYCETNISEQFPERNSTFEKRWVYDDWGRLVRVQRFMLSPRVELLGEEVYEYDQHGRIHRSTLRGETGTVSNEYTYNAAGSVTEIHRVVRELSGWRFAEHIRFSLDEHGNWIRAAMESDKRPCIIERVIEYY